MTKFKFSERSKNHLKTCDKALQKIAKIALSNSDIDFAIICGYRSEAEQIKLFEDGFSKLTYPNSRHNQYPSLAFDFAPYVGGQLIFDDHRYYYYIAGLLKAASAQLFIDIRWGGNWDGDATFSDQKFNDLGHVEIIL